MLGSGHVAQLLGAAWKKAGHDVELGSRDAGRRRHLPFRVAPLAETVRRADVVVDALPGAVAVATVAGLGAGLFAGKVVLDVANALSDGLVPLYLGGACLAERLQAALPAARVVKSLNTTDMAVVVDPGRIEPSTIFLSGDDEQAKATVGGLVRDLGWPDEAVLDLGGIETARAAEGHVAMLSALSGALGTQIVNIRVVHGHGPNSLPASGTAREEPT
jgi:predicted dinucleotide-binding enzyme